jgi:hypothetical protein
MAKTGAPQRAASRAGREPAPAPRPPLPIGAIAFALAALIFLTASLTVFRMSNNDIWIHLRTGQTILQTWSVPDNDPYSFTASDHDYVAHEWLSGVLFHLVYAAGGVTGLIFFKAGVILATCAALLGACLRLGVRLAVALPCFVGMLFVGSARFLERPHIFSYLFIALYLFCYFSWRRDGRRAWLYAIPVLHIFWTNLHGGHFQGLALLFMLGVAEIVMHVRARWLGLAPGDARPLRDALTVAALLPASLLTALINPYGYRLLTFPFELTGQEIFMKGIYEWQSALFPSYNLSSMFMYYIIWTSILFGSFLFVRGHAGLRGGWREAAVAANIALVALWLLFAYEMAAAYRSPTPTLLEKHQGFWYIVVAFFLLANAHRLEFHHAGIVALFFFLSLRHNRAVTDAVVATLPTLAWNLETLTGRLASWGRWNTARPERWALYGMGIVMAALGWHTFQNSYLFGFSPPTRREMGLGIASNMPVEAVNYIETNRITGRCLPSYNAAAMLIHRMWPDVKVAMDSRNDVYGETLYREYVAALQGGEALDGYLRRHEVDFLLLTYAQDRTPAVYKLLDGSPEWTLVYFDDRHVVYLREQPRFAEILRRDGYELISPARAETVELTPEKAPQWLAEATRAAAAAPHAWSPLQYQAKAFQVLERREEAIGATLQLLRINPGAWFAWQDLGHLQEMVGRPGEAAQAYQSCLQAHPGARPCQEGLMRVRGGRP